MDTGLFMIDEMLQTVFSPEVVSLFVVFLIIYSFFRNKGSDQSRRRTDARKKRKRRELTLIDLASKLNLPNADLVQHVVQYKTTAIAKRTGGKRILHVPDRATKHLQRKLLQRLIGRLSIHDNVHGFRRGHSIVDNAAEHVGREVIVKLDIVDFFPSTTSTRVEGAFRGAGFDQKTSAILTGLTCYDEGLPQGAPTSPALSNYVNKNMDAKLAKLAVGLGARYTRYADDLTFSFSKYSRRGIHRLLISTGKILQHYGYRLNGKKKRIVRQHCQQLVTGLVVNERVNLPRKTRRWLRSVKYRMETGGKATLTNSEFRGWLSLLKMVDANSPLLTFLDSAKPKKEEEVATVIESGDAKLGSDGQSSKRGVTSRSVKQAKSAEGREGSLVDALGETPSGVVMETILPTGGNLSLVEMVKALEQTEKYSTQRSAAEEELVGGEYLINISVSSIGRTFSFALSDDYRDGQTLKGTLSDAEMSLELYCDKQVGSELTELRLPIEITVLIRVLQWNSVFKRMEAVVLHTT